MSDLRNKLEPCPAEALRLVNGWLMLIPLAGVAVALTLSHLEPERFRRFQSTLEAPAPFIIGLAALVYWGRTLRQRDLLFLLLAILTLAMTLRELHDLPRLGFMNKGIYVTAIAVLAMGIVWRMRVWQCLSADWRHTSWLAATFLAYFIALLIQRRAFRGIPGEQAIHRPLEECAETVAHIMFLITSLAASWKKGPPAG